MRVIISRFAARAACSSPMRSSTCGQIDDSLFKLADPALERVDVLRGTEP
jgi:hypothetical protein